MKRLQAANLIAPGVAHGFFGREGGVSTGLYAALNCGPGSKDAPEAVTENRRRVAAELGAAELVSLSQVHSPIVHTLDSAPPQRLEGDAMVTATPGLALGILTADCAPVLLADAQGRVIGAAHAGWKGALGGVLEATLDAMEKLGADRGRIAAAVGPCISQANYEVGWDFRDRFLEQGLRNRKFFTPSGKEGHYPLRPGRLCRRPADRGGNRLRGENGRLHLSAGKRLFQLPPHHPCRGARLRAAGLGHSAQALKSDI